MVFKRCLIGLQKGVSKRLKGHLLQAKKPLIRTLFVPDWLADCENIWQTEWDKRQNDIETYASMTYFRTKTKATRLRMTRIARRQNDIETYASMTYFCTKTKATRLRIARMTRIIIANIIREIRVIRSSNHKVQSSNFKGESFSMSFYLFFIWIYCFFRNLCLTLQTDLIISILIYLIFG